MKTCIIALNSKYIHSSLSLWYLKSYCGEECGEIKILEFTINDDIHSIQSSIYREKADILAFSCYIWNIDMIHKIAVSLKNISPNIKTVFGGPEVSYDAEQMMEASKAIDFIVMGEGERVFSSLLKYLQGGTTNVEAIDGLVYRQGSEVFANQSYQLIKDLDSVPSPYMKEMISNLGNKIVYFESSRGCPFSCSYCLSSTFEGVRYFPMDRVRRDMDILVKAGVKQIKFVDRTFNCNKARAKEIFKHVIETSSSTNFHFEVAGDLFDDEMLAILSTAPKGLIQFEVGVQTTHTETLNAIHRKTDLEKVFSNIRKIKSMGNIHIHMDLIAGLPLENFDTFKQSFNDVYSLYPHQLQLGFLKMLKGSEIRSNTDSHGYRFNAYQPYEILCSKYITYDEILELKGIEEVVERYYNSGRFICSLQYLIRHCFSSPFEFYHRFYQYNRKEGFLDRPISSKDCYRVLYDYLETILSGSEAETVHELLKFDFLLTDQTGHLPSFLYRELPKSFHENCFGFLKKEENIIRCLPGFINISPKQIFKNVRFEVFEREVTKISVEEEAVAQKTVILFNYQNRDKVTGWYEHHVVDSQAFL